MKQLIKDLLSTLFWYFFAYYSFYLLAVILLAWFDFPIYVKDTLLDYLLPVYGIGFAILWMKRKKINTSFLALPKTEIKTCLDDILAVVGIDFGLAVLISQVLSMLMEVEGNIDVSALQTNPVFYLIVIGLIVPIDEEIFFRGFLLEHLAPYSKFKAALIVSIIFGLAHMNVLVFFTAFFMSMCVIALRYKYHSVWPGILVHMIANILNQASAYCNTESINVFDGILIFLFLYSVLYLFRKKDTIKDEFLTCFKENVFLQ